MVPLKVCTITAALSFGALMPMPGQGQTPAQPPPTTQPSEARESTAAGHYRFAPGMEREARAWLPDQSSFYLLTDEGGEGHHLGMGLAPLDDAARAHLKLPKDQGLLVTSVTFHTPPAAAGIEQNDILLSLGQASLAKPEDLETNLKAAGDGPRFLTLLRQGQKKSFQVQPQVSVTFGPVPHEAPGYWIGVNVGTVEPVLRSHLSLPKGQGLIATEVIADGPAAKAGLKVNDILLTIDDRPLADQAALVEAVQKKGGKPAALAIIREGSRMTLEVTPQKRTTAARITRALPGTDRHGYSVNFNLARPGAVLQTRPYAAHLFLSNGETIATSPAEPSPAASPVEKRLDAMDGALKELRRAVEDLTKALKDRK
jgi:membrane-associated protease RseP (regulator of RpoE activity)